MEEALVTDDETESLGVENREAILEFDGRGERMMERFYDVMVELFGTVGRKKPREAQNPFKSYLDCDYSTGFAPHHTLREAGLLVV